MRKQTYQFFVLTFLISWLLWSPFYFFDDFNEFWALPGAWGPTLAALLLTFREKGRRGVRSLLKKVLIWRVGLKYYLFAIFTFFCIATASVLLNKAIGGDYPDPEIILNGMGLSKGQIGLALILSPVFFLINTLVGGPIAEELGWRGYAQNELQRKFSPNIAGLIIGFMWSIWHLPLMIFLPKGIGNMPFLHYILVMTCTGVIFSWLYNRTKGSVLLAILLHGGMNFSLGFLGADVLTVGNLLYIHIVLIIVVAALLSFRNRQTFPQAQ